MKFVLSCYGSRGDVEPCVAIGRELVYRGHDVRMAVLADQVGFVEAAGVPAVAYLPDAGTINEVGRDFWTCVFRTPWRIPDLIRLGREVGAFGNQCWEEMSATLTSLADGADLLFSGMVFEGPAANVAEYYDIPFATLHYFPLRPNGQLLPFLPSPLTRTAMTVYEWLGWRATKKLDDAQRRELGLPKATRPALQRMTERGSLELQAYDQVCFPGLAAEWAKWNGQRPFVGALTMQLATDADEEVTSWIAAGTPPIFFGFGSTPVKSPADTLTMISGACAQLGERALICAAETAFSDVPASADVKVVGTVNYAAIFPACRAVVHRGGAGTTAAGLRAGVPQLILWTLPDQPLWAAQLKRLKVGSGRRYSSTTQQSLVTDLRRILAPQYVSRAREIATQMTKPAESVAASADLLESFASLRSIA